MAIEILGAAGMTKEAKEYYDKKLLSVAEQNLVFHRYGLKVPIPPNEGRSVNIRRFEKFTVTAGSYTLTEGTPPTVTQGTVSAVDATVSQYGMYSQISDMLETQGIDPIVNQFVEKYCITNAQKI